MPLDRLSDLVAVDTETTGTRPMSGDMPFAVSFCDGNGTSEYLRWAVDPTTRKCVVPDSDVRLLREFFRSGRTFVFHHGKFDVEMLAVIGVEVPVGSWHDTLVAMRCITTDEPTYGLKPLAKKYADYPTDDESDLLQSVYAARRKGKRLGWSLHPECKADFWMADPKLVERYAVGDVERTMLLWLFCRDRLDEEDVRATYEMEMRLQPVVVAMEQRGVCVDLGAVHDAQKTIGRQIDASRKFFDKHCGVGFNPNSHQQKGALFERLNIKPVGYTKSGEASWKAEYLKHVDHPIADALVSHADLVKRVSFFDAWDKFAVDGVLHPSFEPQAARTGRFGCREPNLQQVPKRNPELARMARRPFVPRDGCVWIAADYSQMELRMLADLAQEDAMRSAFANGRDIHQETAVSLWGEDAVRKDPELRSHAKGVTFGIQYGIGASKLGKAIGGGDADGLRLLDQYMTTFPGISRFRDALMEQSQRLGYVMTAYGRRLHVPATEPHKAVNYCIQGSGADVCKRAMIEVDKFIVKHLGPVYGLVITVHDEIVVEVPKRWATISRLRAIKDLMESAAYAFDDPLPVDVSLVESTWAEKIDVHLLTT